MAHAKTTTDIEIDYSQDLNGVLTFEMRQTWGLYSLPSEKLPLILRSILGGIFLPDLVPIIYDYWNPLQDIVVERLIRLKNARHGDVRGHLRFVGFVERISKPIKHVRSYDGIMGCFMMFQFSDDTIIGFGVERSMINPKVTQIRVNVGQYRYDHFDAILKRCNNDGSGTMVGCEFEELRGKTDCVDAVRINFKELRRRRRLLESPD